MKDIFNTTFEVSLRILIVLNVTQTRLSIDRVSAMDFMAIYGKDFGVSEYNLHGDNNYRFSEYASKRKIMSESLKNLVLRGYILPHCNKSGFTYSISKSGMMFCKSLNDDYAESYATIVQKVHNMFVSYSDRKIIYTINDYAISDFGGKIK